MNTQQRDEVLFRVLKNIHEGKQSTVEDLYIVEEFKAMSVENAAWFDKQADPELPEKIARGILQFTWNRYRFHCIVSALYHLRTGKPLLPQQQEQLEEWIDEDPFHAQFVFEFTEGKLKRLATYLFDPTVEHDWTPPDPELQAYLKQTNQYETNSNDLVNDGDN